MRFILSTLCVKSTCKKVLAWTVNNFLVRFHVYICVLPPPLFYSYYILSNCLFIFKARDPLTQYKIQPIQVFNISSLSIECISHLHLILFWFWVIFVLCCVAVHLDRLLISMAGCIVVWNCFFLLLGKTSGYQKLDPKLKELL